jgi:hypothetical protein
MASRSFAALSDENIHSAMIQIFDGVSICFISRNKLPVIETPAII